MKQIILLIFLVSNLLFGRDILIGDKIDLAISGSSASEIERAFQDFEIEKIDRLEDKFNITLRSYTPGDHLVQIGDKKLTISVKSALDDIDREEKQIYRDLAEEKLELSDRRFPLEFILGLIGLFILGSLLLFKKFRQKKEIPLNPRDRYYQGLDSLGEEPFYEISHLLREYVDYLKGTNLLSGRYRDENLIDKELGDFLYELDHIKFSNKGSDSLERFVEKSKKIAKDIEDSIGGGEDNA